MKHTLGLLLLFFSLLPSVYASENKAAVGATKEELFEINGKATKETQEKGHQVLWYSSTAPSFASLYYINDINKIEFISLYVENEKRLLQSYIDNHGAPVSSRYLYKESLQDSLHQRIHIWPEKGISVITIGSALDSVVVREMHFVPTNISSYYETWGLQYKENKEATISSSLTPSISSVSIQTRTTFVPWLFIIIGLCIFGGILIFFIAIVLRKKKTNF